VIRSLKLVSIFALIISESFLSSCTPNLGTSGLRAKNTTVDKITGASLRSGQGYVLLDNPIALTGKANLDPNYDLNKLLSPANITTNGFLQNYTGACNGLLPCFAVKADNKSLTALQTSDGKWAYDSKTSEFLQVNTFYHFTKIFEQFFANLTASQNLALRIPTYDTAIPSAATLRYSTDSLLIYADCNSPDNAQFDPATSTLCFGTVTENQNIKFAADSSIIYHETGHYFQKLQVNFRNAVSTIQAPQPSVDIGTVFYTEAGSIGEGLSDYYSYYVNGRTHWGEWAAGRLLNASRPMIESDPVHIPGLSTESSQRLSYPQFLNYDPNSPDLPLEDVHPNGMIISHYLVALTEDIVATCGLTKLDARSKVMHLIGETLSELGDLTTKGTKNGAVGKVNLDTTRAREWFRVTNPITYRSFSQTFAKNLYQNLNVLSDCNGVTYEKDKIETLLDDYGLLIFRTYNQNRNFSDPNTAPNTLVSSSNRKKSIMCDNCSSIKIPMVTTLVGIITEVSDVQFEKASCFIVFTLVGMVTDASDEHSKKACA
jgi:hypothetical protein